MREKRGFKRTIDEDEGGGGDEKYLAFKSLLSQSEADKELTPLRVQRHLLTLHQSHGQHRGPQLTLPQRLGQTEVLSRAPRLQRQVQREEVRLQNKRS